MTGTAMTEKDEFEEIYKLDVIEIPTNKDMIRKDNPDIVYKNENAKFRAVINDIKQSHEKGQPVLVGTISIEKSEKLSDLLRKEGIKHEVLNAKYHEKEAEIIAQAGKYGAVTIATNMAGRGTDIMLGGNSEYLAKEEMRKLGYSEEQIIQATAFNETDDQEIISSRNKFKELQGKYNSIIKEEKEKVISAGGLKIIGTERHESRRIDNQLRGRSGRQGDPGESRFYIGLDDDLMKIFGGEAITKVYETLGADENMPIESRLISSSVESAQRRVEGRNFSIRKAVLNYDDVMNTQREIIYKQRREVLDGEDLKANVLKMIKSLIEDIVTPYFAEEHVNKESLLQELNTNLTITDLESLNKENIHLKEVIEEAVEKAYAIYDEREKTIGAEELRELERVVTLKIVDEKWMDHIDAMDELKDGIGLRAYGQKDPVVQYRIEGFDMFDQMVLDIKTDVVKLLMHVRKKEENIQRTEAARITGMSLENSAISNLDGTIAPKTSSPQNQTVVNHEPKVGRNDQCPCGSGKKYKNCCGKNA